MVQSSAPNVDAWFAEVDPKRKAALEAVRTLAVKHLGAASEQMSYGMPAYVRPDDDAPVFAFNSQKQYISLYVSTRVHPLHAEALAKLDAGKSCIRFRKPEQINLDLLDRMLADTARLSKVVYPAG
ncbi:MAG: DUF1801 domain-containing protein [Alphaproteobacteria bacterium]|nr:DUF1801 domain-containing protein [Alphaproteobacteria bacterium]MBU1513399.1 DUF1801 domain-containing protein [Alphaproteobacteria bacterium]MBU2096391.1 DUF1801 domain-containing protein [Alphaproteobacteria bacterium]MBU2149917.1 DUF1801 domain-containing protein [Alphaproteobacteria bacterium]MBU2309885.1 DUF1801 domain-containing protein [Alphaproteobacteria bacterium]